MPSTVSGVSLFTQSLSVGTPSYGLLGLLSVVTLTRGTEVWVSLGKRRWRGGRKSRDGGADVSHRLGDGVTEARKGIQSPPNSTSYTHTSLVPTPSDLLVPGTTTLGTIDVLLPSSPMPSLTFSSPVLCSMEEGLRGFLSLGLSDRPVYRGQDNPSTLSGPPTGILQCEWLGHKSLTWKVGCRCETFTRKRVDRRFS